MAKNRGASFERMIVSVGERTGWDVFRIADGCEGFGPTLRKVSQPFDFFAIKEESLAIFFDAKSNDKDTFQYTSIKQNQLQNLLKIEQSFPAGYLVFFQPIDQIVFFNASQLKTLKFRQSLKPSDGINIGSFIVHNLSEIIKNG